MIPRTFLYKTSIHFYIKGDRMKVMNGQLQQQSEWQVSES